MRSPSRRHIEVKARRDIPVLVVQLRQPENDKNGKDGRTVPIVHQHNFRIVLSSQVSDLVVTIAILI